MFQKPNDSQETLLLEDEHGGAKAELQQWLRTARHRIEVATSVLLVCGVALDVRESKRATCCMSFPDRSAVSATNIADAEATLVHSRDQFSPRFARWMCNAGTGFLSLIIDRPREVSIRTLFSARTHLNSPRTPPAIPYVCGMPTGEGASTCPRNPQRRNYPRVHAPFIPPYLPRLPFFVFPPPIVQSKNSCATIRRTGDREINPNLIVRP